MTARSELCGAGAIRAVAHSYPRGRDLLAGRRPSRESESAPGPREPPSPVLLTVLAALECAAAAAPVRRI